MKLRATFPVHRYKNRKLEDNLIYFGNPEEYLVCKDQNNRDLLAILPETCLKDEIQHSTICTGNIDMNRCIGCLACQIGIAKPTDGIDQTGIPADNVHYRYGTLSKKFFRGKYVAYPSIHGVARTISRRFNEYTGDIDERNFTNPLIAYYLWATSTWKRYVSSSPNHELSLDVSILTGEREGHLDVALRILSDERKYLFVAEGKRNVKSFLSDSSREQQKKYERRIEEIGQQFGYNSMFSYVIGGNEEPMYPSTVSEVPTFIYRNRFFDDIFRNEKRFVSLHALRGLGILFISSRGKIGVENVLFPLFKNDDVYGLVLGGPIIRKNGKFILDDLCNFIPIG